MRQPQLRLRPLVLIVMATGTVFGLVANVFRFGVPEFVYLLALLLFFLFLCSLPVIILSLAAAYISLKDIRRGIGGMQAKGRWRPGGLLVEVPDSDPGQAIELEILQMVARSPLPLSPQVIAFKFGGYVAQAEVQERIWGLMDRKLLWSEGAPGHVRGVYHLTTSGRELLKQMG